MTKDERLGAPVVEPLSDAAWSRVERGLWARMESSPATAESPPHWRRWWLVAAPLALAAAIAAIVLVPRHRATELAAGDESSRVVSGPAPSSVSFGDVHIELDASTALVTSHEPGHPGVLLERGAAWFAVAPRLARPAFIVRAGDATVRVVGTRFRVARADEHCEVEVQHGLVEVQFHDRVVAVGAGQRWSSESPGDVAAIAVAPPAVAPVAPPEPTLAPVAPPEPTLDAPPAPAEPRPATRKAAAAPGDPQGKPPSSRAAARAPEAAADADRADYDRLAALEPTSPKAALAGYLALARGTSAWAAPALFAAARLAVDHRDPRAETLLGIYLQRFPTGANATDARQLLARLRQGHR